MLSQAIDCLLEGRDGSGDSALDDGFSLVELMVVLLILAILLAIAIPTFLSVTGGANDEAAQSNLNTGLTAAKAAETQDQQSYTGLTALTLHSKEPNITFDSGAVAVVSDVSVYISSGGTGIVMAAWSPTGTCWYTADNISTVHDTNAVTPYTGGTGAPPLIAGRYYGSATTTQANCNADASLSASTGWGSSFANA